MSRISSEKAVEAVGNRYDLILIGSRRARELSNNHAPHIQTTNGTVVTALKEIEQGFVGRDYLSKPQDMSKKR